MDPKSDNKKTYDFHIAGVPYKLRTSHDDETVTELVEFVNNRMDQAISITKNASFQNAAILTAMNLAEELILLKRKMKKDLTRLEDKTLQLAQQLESSRITKSAGN